MALDERFGPRGGAARGRSGSDNDLLGREGEQAALETPLGAFKNFCTPLSTIPVGNDEVTTSTIFDQLLPSIRQKYVDISLEPFAGTSPQLDRRF